MSEQFTCTVLVEVELKHDCYDAQDIYYLVPVKERKPMLKAGTKLEVVSTFRNAYGKYATVKTINGCYDIKLSDCTAKLMAVKHFRGSRPGIAAVASGDWDPRHEGYVEIKTDNQPVYQYPLVIDFKYRLNQNLLPKLEQLPAVIEDLDLEVEVQTLNDKLNSPEVYATDRLTDLIMSMLHRQQVITTYWYIDRTDPSNKKYHCIYGSEVILSLAMFMDNKLQVKLPDIYGELQHLYYKDLPEAWQHHLASYCIVCYSYDALTEGECLADDKLVTWWLLLHNFLLIRHNKHAVALFNKLPKLDQIIQSLE